MASLSKAPGLFDTPTNPRYRTGGGGKPLKGQHLIREQVFFADLLKLGLERPVGEYFFHPHRLFRFDYCWPDRQVALEVEGGVSNFHKSRHTEKDGYITDMEKYNAATVLGWRVLRYTWQQLTQQAARYDLFVLMSDKGLGYPKHNDPHFHQVASS
jgi:hypothetical protein